MPKMPKMSEQAKAAFQALAPSDPAVTTRPMFGNLSLFVNGNMFAGLFGEDIFVRLSDADQQKVKQKGGRDFEPMPGHAMKGYACIPSGWQQDRRAAEAWITRSLEWARKLPAKGPAKKPASRAKARS